MLELLVLVGLGWLGWRLTRHVFSFPARFAALLNDPTRHGAFGGLLSGRSRVSGRFRERPVSLLYQRAHEEQVGYLAVAMQTDAVDRSIIQPASDSGARDPELERALHALEVAHELRVQVKDGWLRATWAPVGFFIFPGRLDPAKWKAVLEHLFTIAGHLERIDGMPAGDRPHPDVAPPRHR